MDTIIKNLNTKKQDIKTIQPNINALQKYEDQLLHYGVYQNRYWKNIEGNQAIKFRKKWNDITKHVKQTTYVKLKTECMKYCNWNIVTKICKKSKPKIAQQE